MSAAVQRIRFAGLSAVLIAASLAALLHAEHGRNFAGPFQIRDVVDHGAIVQFELHVKVFNYSGADVRGVTLTLASRQIPMAADAADYQGSFSDISIPYRKSVELDGTFTVPSRDFLAWQRGAVPNLVATYLNENGKEIRSPVELYPDIFAAKGESR